MLKVVQVLSVLSISFFLTACAGQNFLQKRLQEEDEAWKAWEKKEAAKKSAARERSIANKERKAALAAYCKTNPQDCRIQVTECSRGAFISPSGEVGTSRCVTYWK